MALKKKLLLFAMDSLLSKIVLENILDGPYDITGIVLPSHSAITGKPLENQLNLISSDSIDSIALSNQTPVYYVSGKNQQQYEDIVNKTSPDIIIVACFPYKLPTLICQYPEPGAYNVHPSCLPRYRGPVPLFWQFYYGEKNTGISIHRLSEDFDRGDIVLQQKVPFKDGFSTGDATSSIAITTAGMLKTLARQLDNNTQQYSRQDENEASYYSWPTQHDFVISTNWDVKRAYNFIKGTLQWGQTYIVRSETDEFFVSDVTGYSQSSCPESDSNDWIIRFRNGFLFCR